ncbi:MAG: hypothetical protein LW875_09030 [Proteobacteria bacterium]|jgi:hypothetical protein|nr:hypothetical protein [Pseudomonadota bacterium]
MKATFFVLALSLIASSSFAGLRSVQGDTLSAYRIAALQALEKTNLQCDRFIEMDKVRELITWAYLAQVDDSGPQPAVIFFSRQKGNYSRMVSRITTDAAYAEIKNIQFLAQELKEVNHGTLVQPKVTSDWATSSELSCSNSK